MVRLGWMAGSRAWWVVVCLVGVLLHFGCATPNQAKLNEFSTLALPEIAASDGEHFSVEVARVGSACLNEMFRTAKVGRQFSVYWLSVRSKSETPLAFDRNRLCLSVGPGKNYPVGPGRVAYLCKSNSTALLIAAVVAPVLIPVGAPIVVSGQTAYYAAVNVTGVAAGAHVAGTQARNSKLSQGTRLGSLPETAVIQPGETLAGFLFFEVPGSGHGEDTMEGTLKAGDDAVGFTVGGIPEVNPRFGEEKKP